ncbi:hypothetical protein ES319_D13G233100v1 [Gossypium barbadense]|uniref:Uncharacterized protein n=1 Tax=Gossypium barbadense TaxID=3634 RepID=A0A5J5NR00_GOSBA|nr:hypothetical protein ES319_D13G233100v1 [Gossypium barbadense]
MGEMFLLGIAKSVVEKIVDLSVDEVRLVYNVKTDLKKLEDTMISIKDKLLDAERQQHHNENLRHCMWKLRDIFYDAEDVIDDFKCEALRKQDAINHRNTNSSKQLQIRGCPNLSVLPAWLPNLTSLQKLEIIKCENLSALPEGVDRLTNLSELAIDGCPELSKRYRENGGEDWHKIAHIQKVVIKDED